MKVLFVAEQVYLPQLYGGVQTSTDQLCRALQKKGHKVSVLVKLMPGGVFAWQCRIKSKINWFLIKNKVSRDLKFGYPIWRAWHPTDVLAFVCGQEQPDLIVVMTGGNMMPLVKEVIRTKTPVMVQLHDVGVDKYGDEFRILKNACHIANSQFTSNQYKKLYGISSNVIYPFISVNQYKVNSTREHVTFINPVPVKGLSIAIEVARRCPEIPFTFVEGWTLSKEQRMELDKQISEIRNIQLVPSVKDMRLIYAKTKILLLPSTYEETFGRVATEAQASGIPIVASSQGGLPESVGAGGVLLRSDAIIDQWVEAIQKLWNDETYYLATSDAALIHAQRLDLDIDHQTTLWESAMIHAAAPSQLPERPPTT